VIFPALKSWYRSPLTGEWVENRTKIIIATIIAIIPASFCGCCCFTGMFGSHQVEADRQAIDAARAACAAPSTFRLRTGGFATRPADWECVTADQIAAEQAAAAAEAARVAAAQAAAAEEQRAHIEAARTACVDPNVFRASPGSDPLLASSWACVSPETIAAEEQAAHAAEVAAAERAERQAAEAEAARIAALPMEVSACTVDSAYHANEIAADGRYPEGRRMLVTGRVDAVNETFGTMSIRPRGCMLARVGLADDQRAAAGSLSRGDSFRADCTMGHFLMGASWDDCRLVR